MRHHQQGSYIVEFALISAFLMMILIGIMEWGRIIYTWNLAAETTRYGARLAALCDKNSPSILRGMQTRMPTIQASQINVNYYSTGMSLNACDASNCQLVEVSLQNIAISPLIPFLNLSLNAPPFRTTQLREAMDSSLNSICQ